MVKLSTLRIEPHRVKPNTSREYYAPKEGVVFWRVWLDDELIAEQAYPFTETDKILELTANSNFPYWGDGGSYVSVRRIGQVIIWTHPIGNDMPYTSSYGIDEVYIFGLEHYTMVCREALAATPTTKDSFFRRSHSHISWQLLDTSELVEILELDFPKWIDEDVIYRVPHSHLDTTGTILCRKMQQAIKSMSDFAVCDPPEKHVQIQIGLDEIKEFKEAIWHVGKVDGQFAVWFEQYPMFPLWIRSAAFDNVFIQEEFVKELA